MIIKLKYCRLLLLMALLCLGKSTWAQETPAGNSKQPLELSWHELSPPEDMEMVRKYEAGEITAKEAIAYVVELGKTPVKSLDNVRVRLPGYLVPLNLNKDQSATELLLVPTLGACIHVPPPPPNQTIFIRYPKGIKVTEAGYTAYWIEGVIKVEKTESAYTDVLYTMSPQSIVEFE